MELEVISVGKDVQEKIKIINKKYIFEKGSRFSRIVFFVKKFEEIDEILKKIDKLLSEDFQILNTSIVSEKDSAVISSGYKISFLGLEEKREPEPKEIVLKRGLAFGGFHPTTIMCLELISKVIPKRTCGRVLDLGAGNGILSIMAKVCGAKDIYAVEIDFDSCLECKENIVLNKCQKEIRLICGSEACIKGKFEVILVNIIFHTLKDILKHILDRLVKGGFLIASGFLAHDTDEFVHLLGAGTLLEKREKEGWGAILWQKE